MSSGQARSANSSRSTGGMPAAASTAVGSRYAARTSSSGVERCSSGSTAKRARSSAHPVGGRAPRGSPSARSDPGAAVPCVEDRATDRSTRPREPRRPTIDRSFERDALSRIAHVSRTSPSMRLTVQPSSSRSDDAVELVCGRELEDHPARVLLDVGPTDVGHDVEVLHDLVDHRPVDQLLRERHEQAQARHAGTSPTRRSASAGSSSSPVKNGPNSA